MQETAGSTKDSSHNKGQTDSSGNIIALDQDDDEQDEDGDDI